MNRFGGYSKPTFSTHLKSRTALIRFGSSTSPGECRRQLLGKALEQAKERYVCRFLVAAAYADLGDAEQAFESLEQGLRQRSA
jgi:hypothetical protein